MSDQTERPDGLIILAGGPSISVALTRALGLSPEPLLLSDLEPTEILAPAQWGHPLVKPAIDSLIRYLERHCPACGVTVRPEMSARLTSASAWVDVPAPAGAVRFDRVRVPVWWFESSQRLLVTTLPGRVARSAQRPFFQLAARAHPRQRLAARLRPDQLGPVAELASPWRVRQVVLVGSHRATRLVVVTHDLIAAELIWLALAPNQHHRPWEDPAVQQATSLDLGIAGPHQLQFLVDQGSIDRALAYRLASALGTALA